MLLVLFSFGVLGAAMFAEPAVTQVEEVGGLVHLRYLKLSGVGCPDA
jgi:hypothetical protein